MSGSRTASLSPVPQRPYPLDTTPHNYNNPEHVPLSNNHTVAPSEDDSTMQSLDPSLHVSPHGHLINALPREVRAAAELATQLSSTVMSMEAAGTARVVRCAEHREALAEEFEVFLRDELQRHWESKRGEESAEQLRVTMQALGNAVGVEFGSDGGMCPGAHGHVCINTDSLRRCVVKAQSLRDDVDSLTARIVDLEDLLDDLTRERDLLGAVPSFIHNLLTIAKMKVPTKISIEDANKALERLKSIIEEHNSKCVPRVNDLQAQVDVGKSDKKKLETELGNVKLQVQELEQQKARWAEEDIKMKALIASFETLRNQLKDSNQEKEELVTKLTRLDEISRKHLEEKDRLTMEVQSLNTTIRSRDDTIAKGIAEREGLDLRVQELEREVRRLKVLSLSGEEDLETAKRRNHEWEAMCNTLRGERDDVVNQLDSSCRQIRVKEFALTASMEHVAELEAKVNSLSTTIADVTQERESMKDQITETQRALKHQQNRYDILERDFNALEAKMQSIDKEYRKLKVNASSTNVSGGDADTEDQMRQTTKQLSDERNALIVELAELQRQLKAKEGMYTALLEEKNSYVTKLQEIEKELRAAKNGLTQSVNRSQLSDVQAKLRIAQETAGRCDALQDSVTSLQTRLTKKEEEFLQLSLERDMLENTVAELDKCVLERLHELENSLAALQGAQQAINTLEGRVEDLSSQLRLKDIQNKSIQDELEFAQTRQRETEKLLKSRGDAVSSEFEKIIELETALAAAKESAHMNGIWKDRAVELEGKLKEREDAKLTLENQLHDGEQKILELQIALRKAQLNDQSSIVTELEAELASLKSVEDEKDGLMQKIAELTKQLKTKELMLQSLSEERDSYMERLQSVEKDLHLSLSPRNSNNNSQQLKVQELQRQVAELREAATERDALKDHIAELQRKGAAREAARLIVIAERDSFEVQNSELTKQMEQLTKKLKAQDEMDDILMQKNARIQSLEKQAEMVHELSQLKDGLEDQVAMLQKRVNSRDVDRASIEGQKEALEQRVVELEKELRSIKLNSPPSQSLDLQVSQTKAFALERQVKTLNDEIEERDRVLVDTQRKCAAAELARSTAESERDAFESRIAEQEKEIRKLRVSATNAEASQEAEETLKKKVATLERTLAAAKQDEAEVQRELQRVTKQKEALKQTSDDERSHLQSRVEELEKELKRAVGKDDMSAKLADTEAQLRISYSQRDLALDESERLQKAVADLQRENDKIREERDKLLSRVDGMDLVFSELEEKRRNVRALEQVTEDLQKELRKQRALSGSFSSLPLAAVAPPRVVSKSTEKLVFQAYALLSRVSSLLKDIRKNLQDGSEGYFTVVGFALAVPHYLQGRELLCRQENELWETLVAEFHANSPIVFPHVEIPSLGGEGDDSHAAEGLGHGVASDGGCGEEEEVGVSTNPLTFARVPKNLRWLLTTRASLVKDLYELRKVIPTLPEPKSAAVKEYKKTFDRFLATYLTEGEKMHLGMPSSPKKTKPLASAASWRPYTEKEWERAKRHSPASQGVNVETRAASPVLAHDSPPENSFSSNVTSTKATLTRSVSMKK